jgi:hypothetical protein
MSPSYERVDPWHWLGQPVWHATMPVKALPDHLPTFSRRPFGEGVNVNERFDVIVREPFGLDTRQIPLAAVSKRYALIQHKSLIEDIGKALEIAELEITPNDEARVLLSEYGERLEVSIRFEKLTFDPGDGLPLSLRLFLRNSVDGSCAFEVSLRWFRQICSNGFAVLTDEDSLREIHHLDRISAVAFREFMERRVPQTIAQTAEYKRWQDTVIDLERIRAWVRGDVKKAWGPHAAARVFSICDRGWDGAVSNAPPKKKLEPDELFVSQDTSVAGAMAPVGNVYHAYQALTWVAERRPGIEERETWGLTALALARELAEQLSKKSGAG